MRIPESWKKVLRTPVSHLLRGKVTGFPGPLDQLDTSALPKEIVDAICAVTSRIQGRFRFKAARQLLKEAGTHLLNGRAETRIVEQLGQPDSLASLIQLTRRTDWVLESPFSAELWPLAERCVRVGQLNRRTSRRVLKRLMRSVQWQLDAGQSMEKLSARYGDAIPMGKLIQETGSPELVLEFELPADVMTLICSVVRRTRLWSSEKLETARELATHFSDGLSKGNSPQELIQEFGSPVTSARLIRRACLRNRPLSWRIWRRSRQLTAVTFVTVFALWSVVAIRFMSAGSVMQPDLVGDYDETSRSIPEQERAWPLYRKGLTRLDRDAFKVAKPSLDEALRQGPEHETWKRARAVLEDQQDEIEIFLKATQRPRLGFINRDPENELWLQLSHNPSWDELNPPGQLGMEIRLPQAQDLAYIVANLFSGEFHLAVERGDGERCLKVLLARLKLAEHYRQSFPCLVCEFGAIGLNGFTSQLALNLVMDKPELLSDKALRKLFRELASAQAGNPDYSTDELIYQDLVDQLYSDDGGGNGRLTPRGFRILQVGASRMVQHWKSSSTRKADLGLDFIFDEQKTFQELEQDTTSQVMVAPLAALIADRKELKKELRLLLNLLVKEQENSGTGKWDRDNSEYVAEYRRLTESRHLRLKYLPILIWLPDPDIYKDSVPWWLYANASRPQVQRDAALLVIAAELYRREHGQFPTTADELVPDQLSAVPIDPYTEKPLRYFVKEGRPFVESEGLAKEEQ